MIKKVAAVVLLLVTVFSLSACFGGTPAADEIIDRAAQAMAEVKTYRMEADMSLEMSVESEGESFAGSMSMSLEGALDMENQEMMATMEMAVDILGITTEVMAETYVVDDVMYATSEDADTGEIWVKSEVPEELLDQMNQVEPQMEMLEMLDVVQVDLVGSDTVKGNDCYVLELTPDMAQLWQLLNEQSLMSEEDMLPDVDAETIQEMFKDFSVKQWINKETYFLNRAQIEMELEMTAEDLGYPEEEGSMALTLAMDIIAYDYNQPVDIVLPAGAENAIDESDLYYDSAYMTVVDEANNEMYDVEIGVLAAMVENDVYELTTGGTVGPGYESSVYAADGVTQLDIAPYLYSYLEATYTLAEDGHITSAMAEPGGSWNSLTFTEYYGWVE